MLLGGDENSSGLSENRTFQFIHQSCILCATVDRIKMGWVVELFVEYFMLID